MNSLYLLFLCKATNYFRRVSWKLKTETCQLKASILPIMCVCNKHYTLLRVRVAAGNDTLQIWDVLDFKRSESSKTILWILLWNFHKISSLHRYTPWKYAVWNCIAYSRKRNICYTMLYMFSYGRQIKLISVSQTKVSAVYATIRQALCEPCSCPYT
jgi:hypothetical protein